MCGAHLCIEKVSEKPLPLGRLGKRRQLWAARSDFLIERKIQLEHRFEPHNLIESSRFHYLMKRTDGGHDLGPVQSMLHLYFVIVVPIHRLGSSVYG